MKIKLINILSIMVLGSVFMFTSCEEKDDYDYNAIDPEVQNLVGETTVRGGLIIDYRARGRGGSTYEFTKEGAIESLTPIEGEAFGITADFMESFDDQTATITVVETTMGGKKSDPFSLNITVTKLRIGISGDTSVSVQPETTVTKVYKPDFKGYPDATYKWFVTGDPVSVSGSTSLDSLVVVFSYPDEPVEEITIELQVTTRRNNVITNVMEVDVKQFCPLVMEEMEGDWNGTVVIASSGCQQTATVAEVDEEDVSILMTGFVDFLTVCNWGENWVIQNGLKVLLHEPEGLITIPLQYYGQSDYPDYYFIRGVEFEDGASHHGIYDFCVPSMTIKFEIWLGEGVDANGNPIDGDGNILDVEDLWNPFGAALTSTFTLDPGDNKGMHPISKVLKRVK